MSETFLSAVQQRHEDCGSNGGSSDAEAALSLAALLVELEIEKYRAAFADHGIGDADVNAARFAGENAIDEIIAAVGLRGGSAARFRRRLLTKAVAATTPAVCEATSSQKAKPGKKQKQRSSAPSLEHPPSVIELVVKDGLFHVTREEELDELFKNAQTSMMASGVVVVEFSARWCGGCQKFKPTYARMVEELESSYLCVVDVDAAPGLAEAWGATQLPFFVIFRNGVKWDSLVGGKATILKQKVAYAIEGRKYKV